MSASVFEYYMLYEQNLRPTTKILHLAS